MTGYLLAFSWGICIILALIGWGILINRILFPKCSVDWGLRGGWGIAFSIVLGGILNVTWTISSSVILIYLSLGLVCWIFDFCSNRNLIFNLVCNYISNCRKDRVILFLTIVVCLMIGLQYAGSVSAPIGFQEHDDYHAYFVFPNKMLQMGSLGPDPFSQRRLMSSLGGQSFLDTFTLSILSEKSLNIIDQGCGVIIIFGLIIGWFKEKQIQTKTTLIFLIIFLFLVIGIPDMNITSFIIAAAVFLSSFRTIELSQLKLNNNNFIANGAIIALLTAATCALKSNIIPTSIITIALSYCFYIIESDNKKSAIYEFLLVVTLTFVFLLPWMISTYQSSGTLLYPILGKGYHGSVYGDFLVPASELTISKTIRLIRESVFGFPFLICYLLSFIVFRQEDNKMIARESVLSVMIGIWIGAIAITLSTGGWHRYSASFVLSGTIILMTIAITTSQKNATKYKTENLMIISFLVGVLFTRFASFAVDVELENIKKIQLGLNNLPLVTSEETNSYIKMQQSIPEGETVLTRLEKPFLLDFTRNKIFIADYPGSASLPPGMPFFKGGESLANYLTSKSIRYVAYSYKNEAGFQKARFADRLKPETDTWLRNDARYCFDFQDNLKQLGETRKKIYDDGENFVIDLLL